MNECESGVNECTLFMSDKSCIFFFCFFAIYIFFLRIPCIFITSFKAPTPHVDLISTTDHVRRQRIGVFAEVCPEATLAAALVEVCGSNIKRNLD